MSFSTARIISKKSTLEFGKRTYTVVYETFTTGSYPQTDGPIGARMASGIPSLLSSYAVDDTDSRAYLIRKQADLVSDRNNLVWHVTCYWETLTREQKKMLEHPLSRPWEISYGQEQFQESVWKDIDGNAILNSAKQYFDPPIERDASRPTLRVTRNEATFPDSIALAYTNAINSDAFLGGAPGTVKCMNIAGDREIEEFGTEGSEIEVEYWRMTYEFMYRSEGWQASILDQGRYEYSAAFNAWSMILDAKGMHVADPVPLDGAGGELANPTPATAVFLDFDIYQELPFAAFNFT